MTKFKVGDKVRDIWGECFPKSKILIVSGVHKALQCIKCRGIICEYLHITLANEYNRRLCSSRFELVFIKSHLPDFL